MPKTCPDYVIGGTLRVHERTRGTSIRFIASRTARSSPIRQYRGLAWGGAGDCPSSLACRRATHGITAGHRARAGTRRTRQDRVLGAKCPPQIPGEKIGWAPENGRDAVYVALEARVRNQRRGGRGQTRRKGARTTPALLVLQATRSHLYEEKSMRKTRKYQGACLLSARQAFISAAVNHALRPV